MDRPSVNVAVVMERVAQPNRWEDWQHRVVEVVADEGVFGTEPRKLHDDGKRSQWLFPGHKLELFADECKGYFLNLTSGAPVWFVMWRADEGDAALAWPVAVSVSYIEADRWLCAESKVDNTPCKTTCVNGCACSPTPTSRLMRRAGSVRSRSSAAKNATGRPRA